MAFAGWVFDLTAFKSVRSGWISMMPNTALAFIITGFALVALHHEPTSRGQRVFARVGALCVAVVGGLSLLEYLGDLDLGIDQLLFADRMAQDTTAPGRMAPATGFGFFLVGLAVLFSRTPQRRLQLLSTCLALAVGTLGLLTLVGYAFDAKDLYRIGHYTGMALNTGIAFLIVAIGLLGLNPDRGLVAICDRSRPGGMVVWRLLPIAVVLPVVLGWLRLLGQRTGWYDTALGAALFAVSFSASFVSLIWWTAASINRVDAEKKETEFRYRTLCESLPQLVWTCAPDGPCDYLSPQWLAYTGVPAPEQLGYGWLNQLHPDDRQRTIDTWDNTVGKGTQVFDVEFRLRRADGVHRWFKTRAVPLRDADGRIAKWFGTSTDIDDLKHAEDQVRRSNAHLDQRVRERTSELDVTNAKLREERALIEAVGAAQTKYILGATTAEVFDPLLANLLKLTGSEYGFIDEMLHTPEGKPYLIARAITDISWNEETRKLYPKFLSGELRFTNLKSLFGAVMTTGKPVIANDAPQDPRRCGIPAGHPVLRAFLGLPLYSGNEMIGVIGLANRPGGYTEELITHLEPLVNASASLIAAWRNEKRRREAEEAARSMNIELARRGVELVTVNHELEAFAYSVSHDLRAPLRGIDGFSRIILRDEAATLSKRGREHFVRIRDASQRMAVLIDDLLQLSRTARSELHLAPLDLAGLARAIAEEFTAGDPARHVEWRIAPALPARADTTLIRVVLENLLGNAWKFTSRHADARIEFDEVEQDGERVFRVRDNGAGLDMRYAGKLFGAFQRLHSTDEFPGNGIGLATVQRVVHRHGGQVWAEGRVGMGASFYFTLPQEDAKHEEERIHPAR